MADKQEQVSKENGLTRHFLWAYYSSLDLVKTV